MEAETSRKPFNTRGFIAIVLVTAGAILPVSGVMNHQLQMDTLTTARHFWMAVHNMAATLFVLASAAHGQEAAKPEVVLKAQPGWDAALVYQGDAGVWTCGDCKVCSPYGCPDLVALDGKGRCTR